MSASNNSMRCRANCGCNRTCACPFTGPNVWVNGLSGLPDDDNCDHCGDIGGLYQLGKFRASGNACLGFASIFTGETSDCIWTYCQSLCTLSGPVTFSIGVFIATGKSDDFYGDGSDECVAIPYVAAMVRGGIALPGGGSAVLFEHNAAYTLADDTVASKLLLADLISSGQVTLTKRCEASPTDATITEPGGIVIAIHPICASGSGDDFSDSVTLHLTEPEDSDDAIEGDDCGGASSPNYYIFGRCCAGFVTYPGEGVFPAEMFTVLSDTEPDTDTVYKLSLVASDGSTYQVCGYYYGQFDYPAGPFGVIVDSFDSCSECVTPCVVCCGQLESLSFTLPTITDNPYDIDVNCAGIYAAYNSIHAGRRVTIQDFTGCSGGDKTLPSFSYTTSGGCTDGTDGHVFIGTSLNDLGGGSYEIRIRLQVIGSGSTFADWTYTYTQAGCLNCINGEYPATGVNNAGSSAAPSIGKISLNGVNCDDVEGFAMAEPKSEAEALALAPGTKFIAPDGSIRVV